MYKCEKTDTQDLQNSRWALSYQGDQKVHVVDEGDKVWTGMKRLVFISRRCVFIDVDNTILHASNIADVWKETFSAERILTSLRRRSKH